MRSQHAGIVEKFRSCACAHSPRAVSRLLCRHPLRRTRMRLRLIHRFFIAFAALSLAALVAFALLQQDGFRRGFLDYLDGLSVELLNEGSQRLAARYREEGSWDFLRDRPRVLMDTLGINVDARMRAGLAFDPEAAGPPRGPPAGERRPPPPGRDGWPPRPLDRPDGPPFPMAPPPATRAMDPLDIGGRLLLLDVDGNAVAGNPNVSSDARVIEVRDHGQLIGRLRLAPLPHWRGELDKAFARSQWRRALIGGAAILCCALLLAWLLSRWLQRPIRALAKGAQALAAGDYTMRVHAGTGDELSELASDFNRLAAALERSRAARRQWGADIAHELRTPLAILHGEIQALQDGVRQYGPGTLASLQAETTRLTSLVEDLYQLALSDAGALEYRAGDVDLGELLGDLVHVQQATMRDAGLQLDLAELPAATLPIRGDERRLQQLFGNLLANARRYTDSPGRVQISVQRSAGYWLIHVDDTPPSVSKEALPMLFERLYRADGSRNRASGGAGLGLAIARNIVEAHAGSIAAQHSPLGGLRILIELPIVAEPQS
jgi:two-component system, OmpR family, sensor histidine kinase BaeS